MRTRTILFICVFAILLIAFIAHISIAGMERFEDVMQDASGNVIPGATITVYASGTSSTVPIYSDSAGTPKANPFTSDSAGRFFFYAADGVFDVKMVKAGYTTQWRRDVQLDYINREYGYSYDSSDFATINAAVNAIGSTPAVLVISTTETLNTSLTVTSTITLRFVPGGKIVKASTYTLTVQRPIEAERRQQLFQGFSEGEVTLADPTVYPGWFGAAGNGIADDSSAINVASAAVPDGGTLDLSNPPLTYLLSANPIKFYSRMKIKGTGASRSISGTTYYDVKLANSANKNLFVDAAWANNTPGSYAFEVLFDGVAVDGNSANNTSGFGIVLLGGTTTAIKNSVFNMIEESAIKITHLTSNTTSTLTAGWYGSTDIRANRFTGFGDYALFAEGSAAAHNTDSYFSDNTYIDGQGSGATDGLWALYLQWSGAWRIEGNHSFNTYEGYHIGNPANNTTVTGNIVEFIGDTTGTWRGIQVYHSADTFSLGTIISGNFLWLWGTQPGVNYYGITIDPNNPGTYASAKQYEILANSFRGFTDTVTGAVAIKFEYSAVQDLDICDFKIRDNVFPASLPDARKYEVSPHAIFEEQDGLVTTTTDTEYYITARDRFVRADVSVRNVIAYLPFASRSKGRVITFSQQYAGPKWSALSKQGSDTLYGFQYCYDETCILTAFSDGTAWYVGGYSGVRTRYGTPIGHLVPDYTGQFAIDTFASPHDAYVSVGTTSANWEKLTP